MRYSYSTGYYKLNIEHEDPTGWYPRQFVDIHFEEYEQTIRPRRQTSRRQYDRRLHNGKGYRKYGSQY